MTRFVVAAMFVVAAGAQSVAVKPEEVGMSGERLKRIHEAVQRHMDAGSLSGAVTLVSRRGKVAHFEAHGLADLETKKPMAKDAIFRLASMTKPITGVAVMMLVEEGKVRLNDPVSRFLPEFKDTKVAVAQGSEITFVPANRPLLVRDLLTHTSGLGSGGAAAKETARLAPIGPGETLETLVAKLAQAPLDFQPGTQWAYSGRAALDVLSRICEVVSGQTYDVYLKTRIFDPLGMPDTFFYPPEAKRARIVTLYQRSPNGLVKAANQDGLSSKTYFSGGAALMSTAADYLKFAQMMVNGGELNGKRLLGPRTVELMASNHVGEMFNGKLGRPARGMGFGLIMAVVEDPVAAGLRLSKGSFGWDGLYGTQVWMDPKEKMVSLLMIQTQIGLAQRDFENAVMQAIVD